MQIENYLSQKRDMVDKELKRLLPGDDSILSRSMRYSALAPGKRIRAILAMASCAACGGKDRAALRAGCAIELLHSFSLIHDDLPAMDDDPLRRGLPTNHIKFGEATAILAGDALFALAYNILSIEEKKSGLKPAASLKIVNFLSAAIGHSGMCSGQSLDLESENKKITFEKLKEIHSKKTGELIKASVFAGSVCAGANQKRTEALLKYAKHIGMAFQIKDDILDVSSTARQLGKTPGSDMKKKKSTYVSLFGVERAKEMMRTEISMALSSLKVFGKNGEVLKRLAVYISERDK